MDLRAIVLKEIRRRDMSAYRLAQLTGLPMRTLQRFTAGDNDLRLDALGRVLDVLGFEIRPAQRRKGKVQ